jgi:hypothetical protein
MKSYRFARCCRVVIGVALALSVAAATQAQESSCGPLTNHYGPFDYRTQRDKIKVAEDYHFTPEVEALIRGKSGTSIAADISYVLAVSPNHHRALVAATRLAERMKTPQPPRLTYSVDCYYERAIRFARNDGVVRVLYALYLHKQRKMDVALHQLSIATEIAGDNALSHYNIGLAYFELGELNLALAQAHRAKALGFDANHLADLLRQKNAWKDPVT